MVYRYCKKKISDIQKSCSMLDEEYVNSMTWAEKKNDLSYVHKGNALKRKNNEMKSGIKDLKEALQASQEKRKKSHISWFIS